MEAGTEILVKNACGDLDVNYKVRDILKRYTLTLETLTYDPEFEELLLAATLLTQPLGNTRTVADGVTVSGSAVITSATAAFGAFDVGSTVTGTGIGPSAVVASVQSPTQATLSVASTASASTVSITLTAAAISIGTEGTALGTLPTDLGVSFEGWVKNVRGGVIDPVFPWTRIVFPATFWSQGDPTDLQANTANTQVYNGYAVENINWGNGPWNDWGKVRTTDAAKLLTSGHTFDKHFTNWIPATQVGYIAVPTQV